jgi:hypothetical protein
VPSEMLGRVVSIAGVLAWSGIPVGTFLGGVIIQRTGNAALVYMGIGVLTILIPLAFRFTALGHAEQYLPTAGENAPPGPESSGSTPLALNATPE